jgi:hypothetical protein
LFPRIELLPGSGLFEEFIVMAKYRFLIIVNGDLNQFCSSSYELDLFLSEVIFYV